MSSTIRTARPQQVPLSTVAAMGFPLIASEQFLRNLRYWSWGILAISAVLQCILFGSWPNARAVACVAVGWGIANWFLQPQLLKNHPLSCFLILGFTCTQLYFPLVFTLLEGKPIVYNLVLPDEVFLHSLLGLSVLTVAHLLYWFIAHRRPLQSAESIPKSLLVRIGLFTPPTDLQIWLMGFIGLAAMYYVYFYSPSVNREVAGAADKSIQGLIPFTYAPYFIPFGHLYGRTSSNTPNLVPKLAVFTIVLFIVSIGTNSRGAFMLGFTSVGFTFALGLMLGAIQTKLFTLKNILLAGAALWVFTGPVADIGTAMVMVRNQRSDTPRSELVALTWEAFQQKDAIKAYRADNSTQGGDWDEDYMDNIFLARFCNIKYNDASLVLAQRFNSFDRSMRQFTISHALSSLPQPVLDGLGVKVDKEEIQAVSYGDILYYKVSGDVWSLGSFRTGHFAGVSMTAFGWWYLLLLGIGILPVYYLYDLLYRRRGRPATAYFSFCGLLSLTSIFLFFPSESLDVLVAFILRAWVQLVLLYAFMFHITRYFGQLLGVLSGSRIASRPRTAQV
ncbi:MAG: hypothetical protein EOO61_04980 [Hymenobacter sp.]|nr:MAG: hypothetical protein EOO61_04980 [Hymenobacter sp.]